MTSRGDIAYQFDGENHFLKVYKSALLFLPLPFGPNGGGKKINQYTVTMEIQLIDPRPQPASPAISASAAASRSPSLRPLDPIDPVATVPPSTTSAPAGKVALIQTARYNEDAAEIYITNGLVGTGDARTVTQQNKVRNNQWVIVTVVVDCVEHTITTFLDGKIHSFAQLPDEAKVDSRFAVANQLCVFGSVDPIETVGGHIRLLLFEPRALLSPVRNSLVASAPLFPFQDVEALYGTIVAETAWTCPVSGNSYPRQLLRN